MSRRAWLIVLWLYAAGAAADCAVHLVADRRTGGAWPTAANLAVAFSASLFWPIDGVAQLLLR
jgi:hypothetical protein